jgi:peptidyl-prolyl cis-trans isomerase C
MNRRHSILALLVPLLLLAACGKGAAPGAAEPTESVATVNGKPITKSELDLYVANVGQQSQREVPAEQRPELLDQYISMKLAAAEAEKTGIMKEKKVEDQLALARMNVIVDAGLQKWLEAHPVADSELKPEYDQQIAAMPREYHARHILVEDKDTADGIVKQLKGGADFAKLAETKSKDSSNKSGGDLGWFTLDTMVKEFSDAVVKLEPGKITDVPVHSQFGWHVIKLEETRAPNAPEFDQVKDRVKVLIQRRKLQAYLDELRKNAKIDKKI